jgi:predicted kinase
MVQLLILRGVIGAGTSTVAERIAVRCPNVAIVDVDRIRLEKHGRTDSHDLGAFQEAGLEAQRHLRLGQHTIVVEAFYNEPAYRRMMAEVGTAVVFESTWTIGLRCSVETSLRRAGKSVRPEVIRRQHVYFDARFRLPRETSIDTDDLTPEQVADRILQIVPLTG